jgi:hypothetical protein
MPKDAQGNWHLNNGRMNASKGKPMSKPMSAPKPEMPEMSEGTDGASHTTLHDHGDGTFHTEGHDGAQEQHPHIGHALMHMAAKHSEGKHMHVHHDGMSMTSHHHMGEGGKPEGPHEHGSSDEAADKMKEVMGDGMEEPGDQQNEEAMGAGLHGM